MQLPLVSAAQADAHPDTFIPSTIVSRFLEWTAGRLERSKPADRTTGRQTKRTHWYDVPGAELGL